MADELSTSYKFHIWLIIEFISYTSIFFRKTSPMKLGHQKGSSESHPATIRTSKITNRKRKERIFSKVHRYYKNMSTLWTSIAVSKTEPGAPVRQRRLNAVPDKKTFLAPRAPHSSQNINDSPKHSNMESKRILDKRPTPQTNQQIQKTRVVNQNANRPVQKTGLPKQEFKRPMQKNNAIPPKTKPQDAISTQKIKPTTPEGKVSQKLQNTSVISQEAQKTSPPAKTKPEEVNLKTQKTQLTQETKTTEGLKEESVESKDEKQEIEEQNTSETEKHELDPLLARVLEEELQDIMIQVWQELPDDPVEEERIAVDKLRNEIGDDFRRVLGLNITQRLLNVYNNLFVKVNFSCRPQMGCLTSFLNDYHIKKFKRIDKNSNTFAAQIDSIEDFDKICNNNEIMCGMAKVTITPCYKFTQCPDNLKTIYDDSYYYENSSQESEESIRDNKNNDLQKTEANDANEDTIETKVEKEAELATKLEVDTKKTISDSNDSVDINNEKRTVNNQKVNDSTKMIDDKNVSNQNVNKTVTVDKEVTKNTDNLVVTSNTNSAKKVMKDTETTKNMKKDVEVTKNTTKDIESTKKVSKDIKDSKNQIKDIGIEKETKGAESNKNTTKANNTKDTDETKNDTKSVNIIEDNIDIDNDIDIDNYEDYLDTEIPENQFESDEELNDEDILALMSEGVVLDECSGSEDES